MNDKVIKVEKLSKLYKINTNKTYFNSSSLKDDLNSYFFKIFRNKETQKKYKDFWAINDLTFEVSQGDVLGVIGKNGSGKSTLLKILSRVIKPTEGKVELFGRIGALLEVGTGFQPDLTGRDNIFLSGSILGMKKDEIKKNFDAIVDFADIEEFVDTPVKRYSSGMFLRLAFSVIAFLNSDILLVDEVLAVGDLNFQKKSTEKMKSIVKEGRTVLFVSHSLDTIKSLCNKCLYLENGSKIMMGRCQEVLDHYVNKEREYELKKIFHKNQDFKIINSWLEEENGVKISRIISGSTLKIIFQYEIVNNKSLLEYLFELDIYNHEEFHVSKIFFDPKSLDYNNSFGHLVCYLEKLPFNSGQFHYVLNVKNKMDSSEVYSFKLPNMFYVEPSIKCSYNDNIPLILCQNRWEINS